MSERHRRAAASKCGVAWQRKINTELFEHQLPDSDSEEPGRQVRAAKAIESSRWDPYERFPKKDEMYKFLSYQRYRRDSLVDRERFAKFSIGETLGPNAEDGFKVTGEIMNDESVAARSRPEVLDSLAKIIRADGQHDVDAEIPKELSARLLAKADDSDLTQKVSAAAQSVLAASPNSLGPPIDPCVAYLKMTKCGQYGRGNSTVWKSPYFDKLDNQDGRRGLLDHQVTAIVWLLSRLFGDLPVLKYRDPETRQYHTNAVIPSDIENRNRLRGPRYFGGILADSMGLGKTLIVVALINLLMTQKLNVVKGPDGKAKYRPILLLTPNATVALQWVQEIKQVIGNSTLRRIVLSGPGLESLPRENKISHLGRENFKEWPGALTYMWNENDPRASQVILIMTMESWALRTCTCNKRGEWSSSFTKEGRGFSLVIVDEAYKVKNPSTKNWRSVYLLERQFTLLITATPCMNSLTDLFGLARLLWTAPEKYMKQNASVWKEIERKFKDLKDLELLDKFPVYHDLQLLAGRPALLARLLCKNKSSRTQDIDLTRRYLRFFERLAMLKRSPSSYLFSDWEETKPVSLEGLFPKVENYTVNINLGKDYDEEYQKVHIDLLISYLEDLRDWGGVVTRRHKCTKKEDDEAREPIIKTIRLLQLASASLDVYDLNTIITTNGHSTLAPKVAEMRESEVTFMRLVQFLVQSTDEKPETHVEWMKIATRNSPILRYILHYVNQHILTRARDEPIKKLLIIEQNLMLAFYYELVLQFLGFECRCMHAQLSLDERQKLVDSFNSSEPNSCQILIQLYTVGFAGTNLHKSCSRVLVASQSHSLQVQWQAIYRVIRVGQDSDVTVHRLKLENSYHSFRESRQIEKILPELGARAHGNTKKVLVRLLNLFQYEVNDAWNSPQGQKLLRERNLLVDDDRDDGEAAANPSKKPKLMGEDDSEEEGNSDEDDDDDNVVVMDGRSVTTGHDNEEQAGRQARGKGKARAYEHSEAFSGGLFVSPSPSPSPPPAPSTSSSNNKKRAHAHAHANPTTTAPAASTRPPKTGDGSGGWYNNECVHDNEAFLALRTRDEYYQEFIDLPRRSKAHFSQAKSALRRLLTYGADLTSASSLPSTSSNPHVLPTLSTTPWTPQDLTNPAVLERALELMLRVRLGASEIAMLPFPLIDLSSAPHARRRHLQWLLAEARHTDQDLEMAGPAAGFGAREVRESLRGADVAKPLAQIDRDLEVQARFGDVDGASGNANANAASANAGAAGAEGSGSGKKAAPSKKPKTKKKKKVVELSDDDEDEEEEDDGDEEGDRDHDDSDEDDEDDDDDDGADSLWG